MANIAMKITLPEEKQGFFCRVPLRMGRKKSPTARAIAGKIFGVSSRKGAPSCWTSYDQIQEEFGICRSTVAASLGVLKEDNLIQEKKRDREGTAYTYVGEVGRRYNVVPLYLFTAEFVASGKKWRLTKAQVLVLSHLMTESRRPKNNGKYEGSIAQLARELSLSETTVKKALSVLMKARLIYRPVEDKGINGHKLTRYSVAKELFDYERKRRVRAAKRVKKAEDERIAALDAKIERERFYEAQRGRAEARANKYKKSVESQVPEFVKVSKAIRVVQLDEVKAQVYSKPNLVNLQAQRRELEAQRREMLKRYQISEERMKPEYYAVCKQCFDTGTLPNGRGCTCYQRQRDGDV